MPSKVTKAPYSTLGMPTLTPQVTDGFRGVIQAHPRRPVGIFASMDAEGLGEYAGSRSVVPRAIHGQGRLLAGAEPDADHDRLATKGTILDVALVTGRAIDIQHQRGAAPRTLCLIGLDGVHGQIRLE